MASVDDVEFGTARLSPRFNAHGLGPYWWTRQYSLERTGGYIRRYDGYACGSGQWPPLAASRRQRSSSCPGGAFTGPIVAAHDFRHWSTKRTECYAMKDLGASKILSFPSMFWLFKRGRLFYLHKTGWGYGSRNVSPPSDSRRKSFCERKPSTVQFVLIPLLFPCSFVLLYSLPISAMKISGGTLVRHFRFCVGAYQAACSTCSFHILFFHCSLRAVLEA